VETAGTPTCLAPATQVLAVIGVALMAGTGLAAVLASGIATWVATLTVLLVICPVWAVGHSLGDRARAPARVTPLARVPEGGRVRITGTVLPGPTLHTEHQCREAVLVRYTGLRAVKARRFWDGVPDWDVRAFDELCGVNFQLRLDGGETVTVSVAHARLLDRGLDAMNEEATLWEVLDRIENEGRAPPVTRRGAAVDDDTVFFERAIGPGDRVEVRGRLLREPALGGTACGYRATPLVPTVCGDDDTPLRVRPV
jgi:type IV secretory pathway TrbD component